MSRETCPIEIAFAGEHLKQLVKQSHAAMDGSDFQTINGHATAFAACMDAQLRIMEMVSREEVASFVKPTAEQQATEQAHKASMSMQPPLLPITTGWYETREGDEFEVIEVRTDDCLYPVVVRLDSLVIEGYHADGMMCHLKGEQACDLIKRTTAPEGGGS